MNTIRLLTVLFGIITLAACQKAREPYSSLGQHELRPDESWPIATYLVTIENIGNDLASAELRAQQQDPNHIPDPIIKNEGENFGKMERRRALLRIVSDLQNRVAELEHQRRSLGLSHDYEDAFK